MATKKKRRVSVRIDMTPMVDIAFLLLIFYMSTTQFKPPEAKAVELPSSHSMIELPDKNVINVSVTRLDSIFVDWVERAEVEVDGQMIITNVRFVRKADIYTVAGEINRARGKNPHALVVLKADKEAGFGTMQDIMKSMQEEQLQRFLIITEMEKDNTQGS